MGGLSQVLRQHAGYAAQHGWAATLTRVLDAHRAYAAAHHLTTFAPTPTPPTGATTSATHAVTKTVSTTLTSSPTPPAAIVQEPLSVAIGGNLDVFLPDLGLGSGGLTYTITPQPLPANMTFQTSGQPDLATIGLVTGDFQGSSYGLEVAVPITNGGGAQVDLQIATLSTSTGVWGGGVMEPAGSYFGQPTLPGNIVAADFNGSGKPGIALVNASTGQIGLLLPDPASDQFFPLGTVTVNTAYSPIGMIAAAPFANHAAAPAYRGPTSDPSTLVQNSNGTWTRTYPDGTVIQFDTSGRETSETDRNVNTYQYAYLTSGPAAGALGTITDPVGLVTTLYDHRAVCRAPRGLFGRHGHRDDRLQRPVRRADLHHRLQR